MQRDSFPVGNMGGSAVTHIHDFHIIVTVLGKMGKPGMRTDGNESAAIQQFLCINDIGAGLHIYRSPNFRVTIQNGLFLGTDMLKLFQKKIVYHKITYLYCTAAGDSLQLQIRTLFRSKTVLPHLLFV